jgi:hypothetical protein
MKLTQPSMPINLVYSCLFSVHTLILTTNKESRGYIPKENKMRSTQYLILDIAFSLICIQPFIPAHKLGCLSGDPCIMIILKKRYSGTLKNSLCLEVIFWWVQKLTKSLFLLTK